MDDDGYICFILLEEIYNCGLIADIDLAVTVTREFCLQSSATPERACLIAKKFAAHIIIDTGDVQALGGKKTRGFGADETRRAGDYRNSHLARFLTSISPRSRRGAHVASQK